MIASFDIDGVIFMGQDIPGVYPGPSDIIITGRSWEESEETMLMLKSKGICQVPFFNPARFDEKSRETSGIHKGNTIKYLNEVLLYGISVHYEDDPIQAEEISKIVDIPVVLLQHNLITKENVRHEYREKG